MVRRGSTRRNRAPGHRRHGVPSRGVKMQDAFCTLDLRIHYQDGKAYAAYLTLPHRVGLKAYRTRQMEPEILVDFDRTGNPLGIELLDPPRATWTKLNRVLKKLNMPPLKREWLRPLRAA